jgi:hypothetical protein
MLRSTQGWLVENLVDTELGSRQSFNITKFKFKCLKGEFPFYEENRFYIYRYLGNICGTLNEHAKVGNLIFSLSKNKKLFSAILTT